jgi:hypothetical protein
MPKKLLNFLQTPVFPTILIQKRSKTSLHLLSYTYPLFISFPLFISNTFLIGTNSSILTRTQKEIPMTKERSPIKISILSPMPLPSTRKTYAPSGQTHTAASSIWSLHGSSANAPRHTYSLQNHTSISITSQNEKGERGHTIHQDKKQSILDPRTHRSPEM